LLKEAVILLGGIGFQPVRNTGKMTGWKPIPRFVHNLKVKVSKATFAVAFLFCEIECQEISFEKKDFPFRRRGFEHSKTCNL